MAGKRRVDSSESEGEEPSQQTASTSKRARTVAFDSDPEVHYVEARKDKGKAKEKKKPKPRRFEDDDSDDAIVDGDEIDEEEEQKFEEENTELVRAAIHAKRDIQGGIAEYGIIESVEMHQFMCHKYLTFKFGEQINFIIGRNGSGKSAVLSAITVALGGKSTSTGRGSGLKSFIREGQSVAEVSIQLKNQGPEAFKPKEYGKSIIITRRFTKDGGSSWKIKSYDGKVISTKRDELSAICDHMNIQVDNPMNVLTQTLPGTGFCDDMIEIGANSSCRQFLSTAHATDKYKFFLRGTQLSQLSDEYDTCFENISQTTKALHQKKECLPDLQTAFKEASARFDEASKAREQKKKADELKKELAWAHVAGKEAELTKKIEDVAKAKRRLPKIEESVKEAQADFESATEEVTRLEAEHRELGDIEHLVARKQALAEQLRANRRKLTDYTADIKKMNTSIKQTRETIEGYEKRIEAENNKSAVLSQGKQEETSQKLRQAKQDVQDAEQRVKDVADQKRKKMAEADGLKADIQKIESTIVDAQQRIMAINETLGRLAQKAKDQYIAYGNNIQAVLEEIKKTPWKGDIVGPLGLHVKVKDPETWAPLIRSLLGSHMTSFAVTNSQDREKLKALLKRHRNPGISIIIGQKDMFDYSRGEPPEDLLTVLRVLEIDDPWVLRILINTANIERTFVALTRREGQDVLSKIKGGGTAWTADMFRVNVYPEGGGSSNLLNKVIEKDLRQMLFSHRDAAGDLQHWQSELANAEQDLKTAQQNSNRLKQQHAAGRRQFDALTADERKAHDDVRRFKATRDALQEEVNNDLPVAVAGLEAAKMEAEKEKESIMLQFQALVQQKAEVDDAQKPLLTQQNELKAQIDEFEGKRAELATRIEDAVGKRMEAQHNQAHYEVKLREDQVKVDSAQRIADDLQAEYVDWTAKAEEFCERYPNPRKADVVKRNLDSVQRVLTAREKRQGATVEEMTSEVNKAKANLDNAQRDLAQMSKLNKALKKSLIMRFAKWHEFRRHIALRCKLVFAYHLSRRGYFGKVLFDHVAGTLHLKVQTDDQAATQATQSREKDPRSLSGGEKSFSTICLLLSLWDSIGCPLRCLDEFDVFMDAVNRLTSMRLMIDTANASEKKQYILITPLDVTNVQPGLTVRVNRMPDPERGQGVLMFDG